MRFFYKKNVEAKFALLRRWCARRDLNPHAREEHWHLKPASLPIPPLARIYCCPLCAEDLVPPSGCLRTSPLQLIDFSIFQAKSQSQ